MNCSGDGGDGKLPFDMQQLRTQRKLVDLISDNDSRDLDHLLSLQGQELSAALRLQRKLHLQSIANLLESRYYALMRQKEEEFAVASQTMAELEQRLRRSEEESRGWKNLAKEAEAVAHVLNDALHRILDGSLANNSRCEGSVSRYAGVGEDDREEGDGQRLRGASGRCRVCGSDDLKVLFIPCMHLSACNLCGPLLACCPVCKSAKQDILEVFLP